MKKYTITIIKYDDLKSPTIIDMIDAYSGKDAYEKAQAMAVSIGWTSANISVCVLP